MRRFTPAIALHSALDLVRAGGWTTPEPGWVKVQLELQRFSQAMLRVFLN